MSRHNIILLIQKRKNHTQLFQICSYGTFFQGTQEQIRNSRDKRAISVRATEGDYNLFLFFSEACSGSPELSPRGVG